MFADILQERKRQEAIVARREEQTARIKKKIWDQIQKEIQAERERLERE